MLCRFSAVQCYDCYWLQNEVPLPQPISSDAFPRLLLAARYFSANQFARTSRAQCWLHAFFLTRGSDQFLCVLCLALLNIFVLLLSLGPLKVILKSSKCYEKLNLLLLVNATYPANAKYVILYFVRQHPFFSLADP